MKSSRHKGMAREMVAFDIAILNLPFLRFDEQGVNIRLEEFALAKVPQVVYTRSFMAYRLPLH